MIRESKITDFKKEYITQEMLHECFEYRDGELYFKAKNFKGKKAGGDFRDHLGYMRIAINRRRFLKHRIMFLYHHGYLPECVDHIDHNPSNNRIENLRASTKAENCAYRQKAERNKYGYAGIKPKYDKWEVNMMKDGIRFSAYSFETKEDAARAYDRLVIAFNNDFACETNFPREDYL